MRRLIILAAVGLAGCAQLRNIDPRAAAEMSEANARYYQQQAAQNQRDQLNAFRPAPALAQPQQQATGVAFLKSSYTSGQNRICVYDRLGSQYVITLGALDICPLTQ